MPSGHTDKRTLTPYRAEILRSLPLCKHALRRPKRYQLGDCVRFGWAEEDGQGNCTLTAAGCLLLEGIDA